MLKFRLAVFISTASAIFTIIFGLLSNIGLLTLAYRTSLSILAFGLCGYVLGIVADTYVSKLTTHNKTKGQNIDISAEDSLPEMETSTFSPLTPDSFEHFSSQK